MRRFWQDVFNYVGLFFFIYVASSVILGAVAAILGLVLVVILSFGLGIELTRDETDALGPIGIGLSVAFLVSLPVALVGTIWLAPSERNLERDVTMQTRRMGTQGGPVREQQP